MPGYGQGADRRMDLLVDAARGGNVEQLLTFIEEGASLNSRSSDGNTPLVAAIEGGHGVMFHSILERNADTNFATVSGQTPLRAAVMHSKGDAWIRNLLHQGAMPDAETPQGTALIAAVYQGDTAAVNLLIDGGASVDFETMAGTTALMTAVKKRDRQLIKTLLEAGADPLRATSDGATACDMAQDFGDPFVVRMLVESILDQATKHINLQAKRRHVEEEGISTPKVTEHELLAALGEKTAAKDKSVKMLKEETDRLRRRFQPPDNEPELSGVS